MQEATVDAGQFEQRQFSIWGTLFWMLFLSAGLQLIIGIISALGMLASGMSAEEIRAASTSTQGLGTTAILASLCAIPFIKKAACLPSKPFPFAFLAVGCINGKTMAKVLLAGVAYYAFEVVIADLFAIDTPQFMLDMKADTKTGLDFVILVLGVCVVAPIFEEILFRGLAYKRLVQSRAGVTGAIIITSIVFTAIHVQYELAILAILSVFALLLGYIRYKTGNIYYCIALHMLLNILSTLNLFLFG